MIVWNDAFLARCDSPWGLLQKLAWLNATTPPSLLEMALGSDRSSLSPLLPKPHGFVDTSWLGPTASTRCGYHDDVVGNLLDALYRRSGRSLLGPFAHLALSENLRFCGACLAQGYHSLAHQMIGVARCPIHRTSLTDRCPHCHGTFSGFAVEGSLQPFCCAQCGESLLVNSDVLKPVSTAWKEKERQQVLPILAWMADIALLAINLPSSPQDLLLRPESGPLCNALPFGAAVLWFFHRIQPFPCALGLLGPRPAGIAVAQARIDVFNTHANCFGPERSAAVHERVDRLFDSTIEQVSKEIPPDHEDCLENASFMMAYQSVDGRPGLCIDPRHCAISQGHHLWLERMERCYRSFHLLIDSSGVSESYFDLLGRAMRSSFYYGVQCVAITQARMRSLPQHAWKCSVAFESDPWLGALIRVPRALPMSDLAYAFTLMLDDPAVLNLPTCDRGAARRASLRALRGLLAWRRSSV